MSLFDKEKNFNDAKIATTTIIDNVVVALDNSINGGDPVFGISWGLAKGMYGANIQLRQKRSMEFVEMIRDNPGTFTKDILKTDEFQDGFVYTFQKYLNERSESKRKIIKDIFSGFAKTSNKEEFKLERFLYTIEQLSIEEIEVLKIFSDGTIYNWHKSQFPKMSKEEIDKQFSGPLNVMQIGDLILNEMKGMKKFKDTDYSLEVLSRLTSLGLLVGNIEMKYNSSGSSFKESGFGKEFVRYILN